ncbi:hypothetical protein [Paenirhodobacter sp.]|uniref:hypothetical protein n=1 Tax=Paenirhodobacter sp. TaxID=1965326 RepID=UPI003B3F2BD5
MNALIRMLLRAFMETGIKAATRTDGTMTPGQKAGKRRLRQALQRLRRGMRLWR